MSFPCDDDDSIRVTVTADRMIGGNGSVSLDVNKEDLTICLDPSGFCSAVDIDDIDIGNLCISGPHK
jgi:hypothetical protein